MSAIMEKNIPAGASEILLKTAGRYCDKDIRVKSHFRMESGEVTLDADINTADAQSLIQYKIPCPSGAKVVIFEACDDVYAAAKEKAKNAGKYYTLYANVTFADEPKWAAEASPPIRRGCVVVMLTNGTLNFGAVSASNEDGCTIHTYSLMAGTYRWKAYYWNE